MPMFLRHNVLIMNIGMEVLYRLILRNQKENNIDSNRIYLTGLSMGLGRLELGIQKTFAALVPYCRICG
jgi:predicted peptidase